MTIKPVKLILTQSRSSVDINSEKDIGKALSTVNIVSAQQTVDTVINILPLLFGYFGII